MSGNHDYPPSRIPRTSERPDILPLQHLRNLVSERTRTGAYNPFQLSRALATLNQEIAEHDLDRARSFEQARAAVDRQIQQLQSELSGPAEQLFRDIHQIDLDLHGRISTDPHRRRTAPRSNLASLATLAPSPDASRSPSTMPPSGQSGRDEHGRQKRRKLDTDDNREGFKGFNYGMYGQVKPGELKMEISSCDGANYNQPDGASSRPENVLDNNPSFYSTKENRCNLVLCHRDEAPFCLNKIVIRAPSQCGGFDAPYQEGMVFVAMSSDELLARTAQNHIQYSPRWRRRNRRSGMLPSQEYLSGYRPPPPNSERTVLMSHHFQQITNTSDDPQAQFRVTTDYDENTENQMYSENEQDTSLEFDAQDEPAESFHSDTDEEPSDEEDMNYLRRRAFQNQRRGAFGRFSDPNSRHEPTNIESNPPARTHPSPEVLKPHARFFIEHEKSMVTIKFDPPPSGRFILIKLWSPRPEGSIDIQSIIAHGYAGPRFFPSIAAR